MREKVDMLYGDTMTDNERNAICMFIYYPVEKLNQVKKKKLKREA